MIAEPLEIRIAPAAVFQYTDLDSDLVTVKLAIGGIDDLVAALTFSSNGNGPRQLLLVNLENLEAPLQKLTITATPQNGLGDGFANVGAISTSGAAYGSFRSRIAAVIVGGSILGMPAGTDSFGFVAQEIGVYCYGKNQLALTAGFQDPAFPVATTADVFVREIA